MNNRILAVIVTYNRLSMLQRCIQHILNQTEECDLLIVDNYSCDGTEQYVKDIINNRINYIKTFKNIGGAGGFNLGMRWAVEQNYEFIWLMDDDCFPSINALEELINADKLLNGKYGWLSSVSLWKDGLECKMNRPKLKKSFYEYIHLLKNGIVQAEQATFVSLFIRRNIIEKYGLVIKEFFIWGDDIEFTRRISVRNKVPCFVVGKSVVTHFMNANNGSDIATDDITRIERYRYAFRNEGYLYRQEGIRGYIYYCAKCLWNLIKIFVYGKDNKLKRCRILIFGVFDSLFFNPSIEFNKYFSRYK